MRLDEKMANGNSRLRRQAFAPQLRRQIAPAGHVLVNDGYTGTVMDRPGWAGCFQKPLAPAGHLRRGLLVGVAGSRRLHHDDPVKPGVVASLARPRGNATATSMPAKHPSDCPPLCRWGDNTEAPRPDTAGDTLGDTVSPSVSGH
jgi:hypothetical protein